MFLIQTQVTAGLDLLQARYAGFLRNVSMKVLHNESDAEDLIQEVFLEVWHRARNYDVTKGRPLAWLVTLTHRRAIDRLRKREVYGRATDRYSESFEGPPSSCTHVHEDISTAERNGHLQSALARLPEAQSRAIKLAFYGEMSQREVAAHTGTALGTIKTRLELGLRKMATFLCAFDDLPWVAKRRALVPAKSAPINTTARSVTPMLGR